MVFIEGIGNVEYDDNLGGKLAVDENGNFFTEFEESSPLPPPAPWEDYSEEDAEEAHGELLGGVESHRFDRFLGRRGPGSASYVETSEAGELGFGDDKVEHLKPTDTTLERIESGELDEGVALRSTPGLGSKWGEKSERETAYRPESVKTSEWSPGRFAGSGGLTDEELWAMSVTRSRDIATKNGTAPREGDEGYDIWVEEDEKVRPIAERAYQKVGGDVEDAAKAGMDLADFRENQRLQREAEGRSEGMGWVAPVYYGFEDLTNTLLQNGYRFASTREWIGGDAGLDEHANELQRMRNLEERVRGKGREGGGETYAERTYRQAGTELVKYATVGLTAGVVTRNPKAAEGAVMAFAASESFNQQYVESIGQGHGKAEATMHGAVKAGITAGAMYAGNKIGGKLGMGPMDFAGVNIARRLISKEAADTAVDMSTKKLSQSMVDFAFSVAKGGVGEVAEETADMLVGMVYDRMAYNLAGRELGAGAEGGFHDQLGIAGRNFIELLGPSLAGGGAGKLMPGGEAYDDAVSGVRAILESVDENYRNIENEWVGRRQASQDIAKRLGIISKDERGVGYDELHRTILNNLKSTKQDVREDTIQALKDLEDMRLPKKPSRKDFTDKTGRKESSRSQREGYDQEVATVLRHGEAFEHIFEERSYEEVMEDILATHPDLVEEYAERKAAIKESEDAVERREQLLEELEVMQVEDPDLADSLREAALAHVKETAPSQEAQEAAVSPEVQAIDDDISGLEQQLEILKSAEASGEAVAVPPNLSGLPFHMKKRKIEQEIADLKKRRAALVKKAAASRPASKPTPKTKKASAGVDLTIQEQIKQQARPVTKATEHRDDILAIQKAIPGAQIEQVAIPGEGTPSGGFRAYRWRLMPGRKKKGEKLKENTGIVMWVDEETLAYRGESRALREGAGRPTQRLADFKLNTGRITLDGLGVVRLSAALEGEGKQVMVDGRAVPMGIDKALRHELVHLARAAGLFTDKEWSGFVKKYSDPSKSELDQEEDIALASALWEQDSGFRNGLKQFLRKIIEAIRGLGGRESSQAIKDEVAATEQAFLAGEVLKRNRIAEDTELIALWRKKLGLVREEGKRIVEEIPEDTPAADIPTEVIVDAAADAVSGRDPHPKVQKKMFEEPEVMEARIENAAKEMSDPSPEPEATAPRRVAAASLPKGLSSAKPRYNMGSRSYQPRFASDVDLALYIVAKSGSKRDADYMKWLKEVFPGRGVTEIREMGAEVRRHLRGVVQESEPGAVDIPESRISMDTHPDLDDSVGMAAYAPRPLPFDGLSFSMDPGRLEALGNKARHEITIRMADLPDDTQGSEFRVQVLRAPHSALPGRTIPSGAADYHLVVTGYPDNMPSTEGQKQFASDIANHIFNQSGGRVNMEGVLPDLARQHVEDTAVQEGVPHDAIDRYVKTNSEQHMVASGSYSNQMAAVAALGELSTSLEGLASRYIKSGVIDNVQSETWDGKKLSSEQSFQYTRPDLDDSVGMAAHVPRPTKGATVGNWGELPRGADNWEQLPDGRFVGYRVSRSVGGRAVSGADSRQSASMEPGAQVEFKGIGFFVTNDLEYAKTYYGGHDENAVQRVAFSRDDVTSGRLADREPEISIRSGEVIGSDVFTDPDLGDSVGMAEYLPRKTVKSGKSKGQYVGAPKGIDTPGKLATILNRVKGLTEEAKYGRYWYERSGREILDSVGGDKVEAERIVSAIAITSASTPVGMNFDFAIQAYSQWRAGRPIKTGRFPRTMVPKLEAAFAGKEWAGRKTNTFYGNLMRVINPSRVQGVTTDIWMMRAFGHYQDSPTTAQYNFVENEVKKIADKLGWEPQQVQAAAWVAMKSRMENKEVKKATNVESKKKKFIRFDSKGALVILDAEGHRRTWYKHALRHSPTDKDKAEAKFDYKDAFDRRLAQISFESIPGRTSSHMPEMFDAPMQQQVEYHVAVMKTFLDDHGYDMISGELGMVSPGIFEAPGYFESKVSPGTQKKVSAPRQYGSSSKVDAARDAFKRKLEREGRVATPQEKARLARYVRDIKYKVDPAVEDLITAYSAAVGVLLKQDGMGWHRPWFEDSVAKRDLNGVEVRIGRPFTEAEAARLAKILVDVTGHEDYNPIGAEVGVRIINFDYLGVENREFQSQVTKALESMEFEDNVEGVAEPFAAQTGYFENNWKENPNGENYLDRALGGQPDLQRRVRTIIEEIQPRIDAIDAEFATKYGWTRNEQINSAHRRGDSDVEGRIALQQEDSVALMGFDSIADMLRAGVKFFSGSKPEKAAESEPARPSRTPSSPPPIPTVSEGERIVGDTHVSPGRTPETKAEIARVQRRIGIPVHDTTFTEEMAAEDARIDGDYDGELAKMLAEIDTVRAEVESGIGSMAKLTESAEKNFRFQALMEEATRRMIAAKSGDGWTDGGQAYDILERLTLAYAEGGSEQGRAFASRRAIDPSLAPAARREKELLAIVASLIKEKASKNPGKSKNATDVLNKLAKQDFDINDIAGIAADPMRSIEFLNQMRAASASWGDGLYEYWRNSLLSGFQTQAVNMAGTAGFMSYVSMFERAVAAAAGTAARPFHSALGTKTGYDAATFREFGWMFHGMGDAFKNAFRNASMTWRAERSEFDTLNNQSHRVRDYYSGQKGGAIAAGSPKISGDLGKWVRLIGFRPAAAVDDLLKTLAQHFETNALAARIAAVDTGQKWGSPEFLEVFNEQLLHPNSMARRLATERAMTGAFQGDEGILMRGSAGKLSQKLHESGVGRWFHPFHKTPLNITDEALKRAPVLGFVVDVMDYRNRKIKREAAGKPFKGFAEDGLTDSLARQAVALTVAALLLSMHDEEDPWLTGAQGGIDTKKRQLAYASGYAPMTMGVGGGYRVSYARIEPVATVLGAFIDIKSSWARGEDVGTMAVAPISSAFNQLSDKTFLRGMSDIVQLFENIGKEDGGGMNALANFGANFASTWVPNMYRQASREYGGTIDETKLWGEGSVLKTLQRAGQKAELPFVAPPRPRYDQWGRPLTRRPFGRSPITDVGYGVLRAANPAKVYSMDQATKVDLALYKYNAQRPADKRIYLTTPSKSYTDLRGEKNHLNDAQWAQYQKYVGTYAFKSIDGLGWIDPENPTTAQMEELKSLYRKAAKAIKDRLLPQWTRGEDGSIPALD